MIFRRDIKCLWAIEFICEKGESKNIFDGYIAGRQVMVVSNETVAPIYLPSLLETLGGREVEVHILPDGEQFKTVETWSSILDRLVAIQARRDATLVALGGGVVGDIHDAGVCRQGRYLADIGRADGIHERALATLERAEYQHVRGFCYPDRTASR